MEVEDIILVWCYRGYRPGIVKEIGKRKTLIAWATGEKEWIENKRITIPENLRDKADAERALKVEKHMMEAKNE